MIKHFFKIQLNNDFRKLDEILVPNQRGMFVLIVKLREQEGCKTCPSYAAKGKKN